MKCPHCTIYIHNDWQYSFFIRDQLNLREKKDVEFSNLFWGYRTVICPECKGVTIEIARVQSLGFGHQKETWRQVYPIGANRGPAPQEVPSQIAQDYIEACNVLPISPKASAALARRCLQNILHSNLYKGRDLSKEIDLLLNESDPTKALPIRLRQTVDGIRHFGNFSAHPVDDKTSLQVIDVEPEEAEWCLDILEELFEHFYVGPSVAKARKAKLDAKLTAAGKPPSK